MIELSQEQHQALTRGETRVRDPETNSTYVLVLEEDYERLRDAHASGPLTPEERQVIMRGVWERAGWDDPEMDVYDRLPDGVIVRSQRNGECDGSRCCW